MSNANPDRTRYTVKMISRASLAQLVQMEAHAAGYAEQYAETAADAEGDDLTYARALAAKYTAVTHLVTARLRELRGEHLHTVEPLRAGALETLARINVAANF